MFESFRYTNINKLVRQNTILGNAKIYLNKKLSRKNIPQESENEMIAEEKHNNRAIYKVRTIGLMTNTEPSFKNESLQQPLRFPKHGSCMAPQESLPTDRLSLWVDTSSTFCSSIKKLNMECYDWVGQTIQNNKTLPTLFCFL